MLDEYANAVHKTAKEKGFWEANNGLIFYIKQCAMIHSEVSELVDAISKGYSEDEVVEEMADIIVRVCDLWQGMKDDGVVETSISEALTKKANKNKARPKMHGKLA
jgi:NTP pyrophosphatase (non-canonical NTP hydrolase)